MSEANSEYNEFVQVRLWQDCINNCSFCALHCTNRKTSLKQKKNRIEKTKKFLSHLQVQKFGLIGGEFFEGQLKGCEDEWNELLQAMKLSGFQLLITANLIHEQYYLQETLDALNNNVLVCTSYDEVGRFHTEADRQNWFSRIETLHEQGVSLFCTCVATEDFFQANTELPSWLGVNLCDPQMGSSWYYAVDKASYHEHLLQDNTLFNLPKRSSAVKWFKAHRKVAAAYSCYNDKHSNSLYCFDDSDELELECEDRYSSGDYINSACGHMLYSQCYADSPKCMMCDAGKVSLLAR